MKDLGSIKGAGLPQAAEARLEQWRLRIRGLNDSVQATEARLRTVALQASAPAAADAADLTPPPTPGGVAITAGLSFVFIETDAPQFEQGHGYLRTLVYGAKHLSGALPTFANAVKVHEFAGNVGSFPSDLGTQWHLWLTWVSSDGVESSVPEGGTNGHQVTTGKIGTADLGELIVTAGKLADGSITAGKLAAQAIDVTKFANGIEPVAVVAALPGARVTATVFNTGDGKLYRWSGSAYVATVPAADLVGQVGGTQIADAVLTTAKFAAGLRPVEIVSALPGSGNFEGRVAYLTTDAKLYRHNGTAWTSSVPATDLAGQVAGAQIADGAVSAIKTSIAAINAATGGLNANTVDAAQIIANAVTALKLASGAVTAAKTALAAIDPNTGNLTANSVTAAQIAASAVTAGKIAADAVTANEIAANAVGVNELAAGAVTTGKLAAGAVTTAALAAGAVTANEIAAGTITGAKIAAGAVGTNELAANSVTAGKIAAGAVTASQVAANAITTDKLLVTGRGQALNADPNTQDISAWAGDLSGATMVADAASPTGTALQISSSGGTTYSLSIPLDESRNYQVRMTVRQVSGSSTCYLLVAFYDGSGNLLTGSSSAPGWPGYGTFAYFGLVGAIPPSTFTTYQLSFGPAETAKIPLGARSIRIGFLGNYTGSGVQRFASVRLSEKSAADLIVDGAITTQKLAAGAVTANEIAANTITGGKIAANTITGSNMVAGSIGTNELAANSITAGKIQAGAVTTAQVAAGAITTDKLVVTGAGAALNDDPNFQDASAWWLFAGAAGIFVSITDGSVGTTALQSGPSSGGAGSWYNAAKRVPVDPAKTYRVRGRARNLASATGDGRLYLGVAMFDASGANIAGDGSQWFYGAASDVVPPTAWTAYSSSFGAGTSRAIPDNARTMAPLVILNYAGTTGAMQAQDLRIEEMAGADLIVDGSIVASKLAANAIAVGSAAIQNGAIVNAMLGDASITSAKIADLSVVNAKLGDASVTAAKIADANITTAKIADANITAAKIADANITTAKIADAAITNAKITGDIQSDNFAAGSAGWRIRKSDGSAEFAAASIRGKLTTNQLEVGSVTANAAASQGTIGATLANTTAVQAPIAPSGGDSLLALALNGGFCRVTATWTGVVGVAKSSTIAFVTCDCSVEMLDEANNVSRSYTNSVNTDQWARASAAIFPNNNAALINKVANLNFTIQFMFSGLTGVRKFRFVLWNLQGVTTAGAPAAPGTTVFSK